MRLLWSLLPPATLLALASYLNAQIAAEMPSGVAELDLVNNSFVRAGTWLDALSIIFPVYVHRFDLGSLNVPLNRVKGAPAQCSGLWSCSTRMCGVAKPSSVAYVAHDDGDPALWRQRYMPFSVVCLFASLVAWVIEFLMMPLCSATRRMTRLLSNGLLPLLMASTYAFFFAGTASLAMHSEGEYRPFFVWAFKATHAVLLFVAYILILLAVTRETCSAESLRKYHVLRTVASPKAADQL